MSWTLILIVVVIIVVIIIYRLRQREKKPSTITRHGYFINQQKLGAIFPQTGDPLLLAHLGGRFIVAVYDGSAEAYVPKPFPEFGGRFIVVPNMKAPTQTSKDPDLKLFACETADEVIDPGVTQVLRADVTDDTNLPVIQLADPTQSNVTWKFVPTINHPLDKLRSVLFGKTGSENIFAEMPNKLPTWANTQQDFVKAFKSGEFSGSLKNVKFPELIYPSKVVKMKRWGPVGIVLMNAVETQEDPQILLVPTLTEMTFRAYSLQTAVVNEKTGLLEEYRQLVATNGASFELTKNYVDTDASRWVLMLAQ